jgi:hypothetical protein
MSGDIAVRRYYHTLGLRDDAIAFFFKASTYGMTYATLNELRRLGIDCDLSLPDLRVSDARERLRQKELERRRQRAASTPAIALCSVGDVSPEASITKSGTPC